VYGLLALIWSSTWVATSIGVDDIPPLYSAGLLVLCRLLRRPLRSDALLLDDRATSGSAVCVSRSGCPVRPAGLH
jgi:hypothetical protein